MEALNTLSSVIWGPFPVVLLLGVGIYLSLALKFLPCYRIPYTFSRLLAGRKAIEKAKIASFDTLMAAIPATIGSGNIMGFASTIFIIDVFPKVNLIWILVDIMSSFIASLNLIALTLFSPIIFALTKDYRAAIQKN